MINVKFVGGSGNNLFQYAAARLIAMKTKIGLKCSFAGSKFDSLARHIGLEEQVGYGPLLPAPAMSLPPEGQTINWNKVLSHRGYVLVQGYLQHHEIYDHDFDEIFSWFNPPSRQEQEKWYNACVVHVRLGDYCQLGWVVPHAYYIDCIKQNQTKYDRVVVLSDDIGNNYITNLLRLIHSQTGLNVASEALDEIQAFEAMRSANTLICPCSTFSWWAGFVGNAKTYIPKPKTGFWSERSEVNLRTNNARFHIVECDSPIVLPKSSGGYNHSQWSKGK